MKRTAILLILAALPLGACSGKGKTADPVVAASGAPKANPWSIDSASEPAADATAATKAAPAKAAPKDGAAATNPWAKDPPPGSQPSEPAADKAKDKSKAK